MNTQKKTAPDENSFHWLKTMMVNSATQTLQISLDLDLVEVDALVSYG